MMVTTHALFGALLAVVVAVVVPEYAGVAVAGGVVGGVFPDLDLYFGHRKTLHWPVGYSAVAVVAVGVAAVVPNGVTVAVAFFFLSAGLHSVADAFGGGLELRPWQRTSERAVYNHARGRWMRPRRWVRYDGAPEDFALAVVLAALSLTVYEGTTRWVVIGLLVVSGVYAAFRKPMVGITERVVRWIPSEFDRYVPERFTDGFR